MFTKYFDCKCSRLETRKNVGCILGEKYLFSKTTSRSDLNKKNACIDSVLLFVFKNSYSSPCVCVCVYAMRHIKRLKTWHLELKICLEMFTVYTKTPLTK